MLQNLLQFPTVRWESMCCETTFEPGNPSESWPAFACVIFVWNEGSFVLANVRGRGWVTPSGRIEPGESSLDAAVRETREEIGAELLNPRFLGVFRLKQDDGTTR